MLKKDNMTIIIKKEALLKSKKASFFNKNYMF